MYGEAKVYIIGLPIDCYQFPVAQPEDLRCRDFDDLDTDCYRWICQNIHLLKFTREEAEAENYALEVFQSIHSKTESKANLIQQVGELNTSNLKRKISVFGNESYGPIEKSSSEDDEVNEGEELDAHCQPENSDSDTDEVILEETRKGISSDLNLFKKSVLTANKTKTRANVDADQSDIVPIRKKAINIITTSDDILPDDPQTFSKNITDVAKEKAAQGLALQKYAKKTKTQMKKGNPKKKSKKSKRGEVVEVSSEPISPAKEYSQAEYDALLQNTPDPLQVY